MKLLIIGHKFPEPTTTAAGGRMMQLIELFTEEGYQITFATTATASEQSADLEALKIDVAHITLNDSSFDRFVAELHPDVVLFDRFMTEEQFGWRVAEQCPEAVRILDTEDLHFLRKARQEAFKQGLIAMEANLYTDTAKRELASILRSDLSLIISEAELEILQNTFRIPKETLYYLPLLTTSISEATKSELPTFGQRSHFVTVGNFHHAPNLDSVVLLKQELWPRIRKSLPQTDLHIYGAYAPTHITQMHNEPEGFLVKGWASDLSTVFSNARVCLAPLRFGAGLKGKLLDAMRYGTPAVTTTIGAEGMYGLLAVPGAVEDEPTRWVEAAITLYSEENTWKQAQQYGFEILHKRFQKEAFSEVFKTKISALTRDLDNHRNRNFIGQILQHQSLQATKYMSKWIEEKNRER